MTEYSTLAAVDLGSNSFRLQVARVVGDQLYPLDSLREPVRLAAGLTPEKRLDEAAQARALEALEKFGERLRGLPPHAVRAVGTNTLRVAKNAPSFLKKAEAALGFPIEIIAGKEEARLIYVGVAHELPPSEEKRLVIDIGGGSTEFIIGTRFRPQKLESLYMGCVSYSLKFFPDGRITKGALKQAELAARAEVQAIAGEFGSDQWGEAFGSSGTARALADIIEMNGYADSGITRDGLERLRDTLLKAGEAKKLDLLGLRPDRAPILAGGFAIMQATFRELGIERMGPAVGALREGVLYDLLGRFHHKDMREVTVKQFMERYHVVAPQAARVEALARVLAHQLFAGLDCDQEVELQLLSWAALLHEVGISVSHSGYHKHTAYILKNADMPGFSKKEQAQLSLLALAHRGSLAKMQGHLTEAKDQAGALALRLAALMYRSRSATELPPMQVKRTSSGFRLQLPEPWVDANPLTATALKDEVKEWKGLGVELKVSHLQDADSIVTPG
ncbi:MAG: exopolyphosphatase [Betaproteobacteria bacterium]|nr:exopolyphosphatase [Betaproteobacteria bacterium]